MREWFLSTELAGVESMPKTRQGISIKASRNNWLKRKASGRGSAVEYHISSFYEDTQKSLIVTYGSEIERSRMDEVIAQLKESAKKYDSSLPPSNVSAIMPLDEIKDWCSLPVYDVYAAAGAGTLIHSEYQIGTFRIPYELLREYGLNEDNSSVIFVDGDSMEPTLSDRDRVLVDISEHQHPATNGVYVIRIDDAVYVKRLHWDIEKGVYNVISDNLKYSPFHIDHNNGRNFKIIGKVVSIVMKSIL